MRRQNDNVKEWSKEAIKRKSIGFVDMCDTWDFDHYPVFFGGPKDNYKTADEVLATYKTRDIQKPYGTFKANGEKWA